MMRIVPLTEYPEMYRPKEKKSQTSWARDARRGRIPGAFQFTTNGDWYVNLDEHDKIVRDKVRELSQKTASEPDLSNNEIVNLANQMGLNKDVPAGTL